MKLADVSIRRPVFAIMMIASLLVFGMVSYPRIGVDLFPNDSSINGATAVALVVRKQSGANTVAVAHQVQAELDALEPVVKKAGATLSVPTNNAPYIEHSINDVKFDLWFGALLAVVVILFFLHDFRATLISALAIPTSVIATFVELPTTPGWAT